jgi:hypothetical protein
MTNLTTALQTLLSRLATKISYEDAPEAFKDTTVGVITGDMQNPFADKIIIYIRKNMFNLITDLEVVITSGVLKDDVAIGLIKPHMFIDMDGLEDTLDDTVGTLISTLKINQQEYRQASNQMELFPEENRLLNSLIQDLPNRTN